MKIAILLGTRPEIIRLSAVTPRLKGLCETIVIHTGQAFDYNLNGIFLDELQFPKIDFHLGASGTFDQQLSIMFPALAAILREQKPDRLLVLGDTNSSVASFMARRLGIPIYHIEGGNRCWDRANPEESNRRLIDHISDVHMPYAESGRRNLLAEGIPGHCIHVTGNPMLEAIRRVDRMCPTMPGSIPSEPFFLSTFHREETVDKPARLRSLLDGLERLAERFGRHILVSTHPRTKARLEGLTTSRWLDFMDPVGFKRFIDLERAADLILTDSGTVPEECAIFGKPCVVLRDSFERPELLEAGCAILSGVEPESILRCAQVMMSRLLPAQCPEEYLRANVSEVVANVVLGYMK